MASHATIYAQHAILSDLPLIDELFEIEGNAYIGTEPLIYDFGASEIQDCIIDY